MRRLNCTWGRAAMVLSTTYLIKRFLPMSVTMNTAIVFIILTRESPMKTPTSALRSIGVPNFPGLKNLAESLHLLSFGIWSACLMDIQFLHHRPTSRASSFLQFPKAIHDLVNPLFLLPMFHSPRRASSVAQFWSGFVHTLFQSAFVVAGGKPLDWITKKLGGKTKFQRSVGLIGIYLASAMQHEHFMPQPPHSNSHTITSLSGIENFFMLQPLIVLIEQAIIWYIPKRVRRTKLWNSLFLLVTTYPIREQYMKEGRLSKTIPPRALSQWSVPYNEKRQQPFNRLLSKKDSRIGKIHPSHNS
ncbi:hypothetical protein DFH28DRAFT_1125613 [Melampsora americana]|nr:hypothetical protein DFH28DRAFT_1125613 [Melampsora americana]